MNNLTIMSRNVASNILNLNSKTIKAFPIVDTKNVEITEKITGMHLRCFKYYPLGFDFITNVLNIILDFAKKAEKNSIKFNITQHIIDTEKDYFTIVIRDKIINTYLDKFSDRTTRQTAKRQLHRDLNLSFILSEDNKSIIHFKAFDLYEQKFDKESEEWVFKIRIAKKLFGGLIDDSLYKNDGDGYVMIPSFLYPISTYADLGDLLKSPNPIYKTFLYSSFSNTHKKSTIYRNLNDFCLTVLPEYLDRNKNLEISGYETYKLLKDGIENIRKQLFEGFFISNVYVEKYNRRIALHYKDCKK
jgi:hypothetical protein